MQNVQCIIINFTIGAKQPRFTSQTENTQYSMFTVETFNLRYIFIEYEISDVLYIHCSEFDLIFHRFFFFMMYELL